MEQDQARDLEVGAPGRRDVRGGRIADAVYGLQRGIQGVAMRVGWKSDFRGAFWDTALAAFKRGQIEAVLGMGFTSYHLIQFSREALRGEQNASFYSARAREKAAAREAAMADA